MNEKRNYEAELASLNAFQMNCYSAILSKSDYIIEKIIRVYRHNIGSLFCDLPKIENYFYELVQNTKFSYEISRFDMTVISFLVDNKNFQSFVESKINTGKSSNDAIVETFIDCGMNSANGPENARFFHMAQDYKKYIMKNNRLFASIEDLEENNYQFSTEDYEYEGENKLSKYVADFAEEYLKDDIEKLIFYVIQKGWTSYTDIAREIGDSPYSTFQIMEITKYIIRKFACYLIVKNYALYEKATIGWDDDKILTGKDIIMRNADVSSIEQAKKILETPRVKKSFTQFPSIEEDLDELRSFCNCRGIKYVEGNFSCNVIMKLYYSVGERESKKTPKTCIYKNGSYLDFITGQKGFIKDIR